MSKSFIKKVASLSVVITLGISNVAFAHDNVTESALYINDLVINNSGMHIVQEEDKSYNVNSNGEMAIGLSFDANGNLYYSNDTGELIVNDENKNGLFFDSEGKYISIANKVDKTEYNKISKRFENGNKVSFNDREQMLDFLEYYTLQYRLIDNNPEYNVYENEDGRQTVGIRKDKVYDRVDIRHDILERFGNIDTNLSDYDKVLYVCKAIADTMDYNLDYTNKDMETALKDGQGVCWHFAKIAKTVLDNMGIESEIMLGYMGNESHMWLRNKIDGKWIYTDPTNAASVWWTYSNMDYKTFIESYEPIRYLKYNE